MSSSAAAVSPGWRLRSRCVRRSGPHSRWWSPIRRSAGRSRTRAPPRSRPGGARCLETRGGGGGVAAPAEPILDMVITDSKLDDAVRPVFLNFAGEVQPGEPFAHMIQNGDMLAALVEKAKHEGVTLLPSAVTDFDAHASRVTARLASGAAIQARLLVAAEGARSGIRER